MTCFKNEQLQRNVSWTVLLIDSVVTKSHNFAEHTEVVLQIKCHKCTRNKPFVMQLSKLLMSSTARQHKQSRAFCHAVSYSFCWRAWPLFCAVLLCSAYHGHVSSLIEISPYKFHQLADREQNPHVHTVSTLPRNLNPLKAGGMQVVLESYNAEIEWMHGYLKTVHYDIIKWNPQYRTF